MDTRKPKQDWTPGNTVRVGFMTLKVIAKIPTPGDWMPDKYELVATNGRRYEFTPHHGLQSV